MSDTTPAPDAAQEAATAQQPAPEPEPKVYDADYVAKLRKEAAAARVAAKEHEKAAAELAAIKDAQKSEVEKAAERAATAEARAAQLEAQVARERIAREKGLADFAEFLTGTTPDEIAASADALAAKLSTTRPPGRPVETLQSAANPGTAAQPADVDSWIRGAVAARSRGR